MGLLRFELGEVQDGEGRRRDDWGKGSNDPSLKALAVHCARLSSFFL